MANDADDPGEDRFAVWLLLVATGGLLLLAAVPALLPGLPAAAVEAGRPKLVLLGLLLLGGLLVVRPIRWPSLAFGLAVVAVHAAALRGVPAAPAPVEGVAAWRVAHANLGDAPDLDALAAWVAAEQPDAVSLQELRPGQPGRVSAALPGYAPAWSLPRRDSRGGGLWLPAGVRSENLLVVGVPSDARGAATTLLRPPNERGARPLTRVKLRTPDRAPLRLVLFSAARPSNAARFATRSAELSRLPRIDPLPGVTTAWLGDFNAPPWSPPLRAAADAAGMRLATSGDVFGGAPKTWPDGWFRSAGLPIDLCLVPAGVAATATAGPPIGSDHRPILVTIQP